MAATRSLFGYVTSPPVVSVAQDSRGVAAPPPTPAHLRHGPAAEGLVFDAVVYRAGPNRNFVRFRPADLPAFAASFTGAPFLRNHAVDDIGARDGTVEASFLVGGEIHQRIRLTTRRGQEDLRAGVIDRFSISWFHAGVECSICGQDWLTCEHWPGQRYAPPTGPRALQHRPPDTPAQVCELIFIEPVGKETSAVNAPAVPGTGILDQLCQLKLSQHSGFQEETMHTHLYLPNGKVHPIALPTATAAATDSAMRETAAPYPAAPPPSAPSVVAEAAPSPVRGIRPLHAGQMQTPEDRVQSALNWLLGARLEPTPPPGLRSLPDLYQAITGDHNWYGVFSPEWTQLASATTTTLAGMVVNALNKVVRMHYDNLATYRWYEQIVDVLPHDGSTHNVQLIMLDGLASLPTVSEGAAYTEATVGDSKESFGFTKRGHYVGITLETIRRGSLQRIQAIPREMVKAAIRARSAAIASIFTANSGAGPTLADDSTALFHADHGNLDTAAFSGSAWAGARQRIWNQVVPGTSSPLGLWPTFCLLPIELYDSALEAFGYGTGDVGKPNAGGTAQTPNPYGGSRPGDPRPIPIAVPDWTDGTDWAYLVDPRLHPVIHMAYANAPQGGEHPLPEVFEVTGESHGLMFTNDTLPVKIRDWWGYGVSTYVGVAKHNVTSS
jgi:hypothetical protein